MKVSSALIAATVAGPAVASYKPVLILHGISGSDGQYSQMVDDFIERGQPAFALPVFQDPVEESWVSLNYQLEHIASYIQDHIAADPTMYADGYHLVCHSQGGLTCRCLTEFMDDHNIDTLVSMAGPQMGVYDEAFFSFFPDWLGTLTLDEIYHVAYNTLLQSTVSVANMWNDPNHQSEFVADNKFLPKYNNLDHSNAKFKENFLSLHKAVFVVGSQADGVTYDGGIGPWESGVFSYYDAAGNFVDMKDQQVYTEDTFGLKTMDERGDLVIDVVPGVEHNSWYSNADIYKEYVFPHLA